MQSDVREVQQLSKGVTCGSYAVTGQGEILARVESV